MIFFFLDSLVGICQIRMVSFGLGFAILHWELDEILSAISLYFTLKKSQSSTLIPHLLIL